MGPLAFEGNGCISANLLIKANFTLLLLMLMLMKGGLDRFDFNGWMS
jgi:hypothetical protein